MKKIVHPEKEHIPQLKKIWKQIFGDTDYYINLFFKYRFSPESALICIEDNLPVSMIYFPQYDMRYFNKAIKAGYICGAATLPEYRGGGIMAQMLSKAFSAMSQRGDSVSVLIPASDSLYGYYEKFGYENCFYRSRTEFCEKNENSTVTLCKAQSPEKIHAAYKRLTADFDFIIMQSVDTITLSYLDYENAGGEVLLINDIQGYCYAFYSDKKLYVKELMFEDVNTEEIINALFLRYPEALSVTVETPAKTDDKSIVRTGMIKPLADFILDRQSNRLLPYMNMMMD